MNQRDTREERAYRAWGRRQAARHSIRCAKTQATKVTNFVGELDNARAAWAWALERENFAALAAAARAFGWFFEVSSLIGKGIEHFESLVCALRAG